MSAIQLAGHRPTSQGASTSDRTAYPMPKRLSIPQGEFQSCAATASLFLYSQGSSILCLHHDTLAIERRFDRHKEDVILIAVDNVSERGAGRLVVSYDTSQIAIVWDLFTGDELARFASYEHIHVAAWMRNGNVAFGNTQGNVILIEPSSSEHISARTIFDPITALAPASDCHNYAIGYNNGSILIAALQPAFTIIHTLSTNKAPSPITVLAWHTSSSKQKSDMLATQTRDGDLRVWSIAKQPASESPRVIRVLKRADACEPGPNWMAWSKNGRIVQYSEGETWAWDVRTKHVTYERIPTVQGVRALANHGPTATLFTLGPNDSVQQYDLNNTMIVANVQHIPIKPPPTPPVTMEDRKQENAFEHALAAPGFGLPLRVNTSESEEEAVLSPLQLAVAEITALETARKERLDAASPISRSSRGINESISSLSSDFPQNNGFRNGVLNPRAANSTPTFTSLPPAQLYAHPSSAHHRAHSSTSSQRSYHKASRLRQEIVLTPDSDKPYDLFPHTRARLTDISYKHPMAPLNPTSVTPDDLRRQMLSVVFGWDDDIESLIRDEISHHNRGSSAAVLLCMWLREISVDEISAMLAESSSESLDWMLFGLTQLRDDGPARKIGQAFVQKLLSNGDIDAAAAILLGLGDMNDAIEVYVSRSHFLEAILLTCLVFRTDWQRQSHLVRKWGESVIRDAQQQLAIRCFACTSVEPSEPWASPTAQQATTFANHVRGPPQIKEPSPSSPSPPSERPRQSLAPNRLTAKNSSLRLITSFGPATNQFKFPGLKSDDRTPTNAPGITPIADSALSPGGAGGDRLWRLGSSRATPYSSRTMTPVNYMKHRLPSIGETPIDVTPPAFPARPFPAPQSSAADKGKGVAHAEYSNDVQEVQQNEEEEVTLLTSAKYDPSKAATPRQTPVTAVPTTAMRYESSMPEPSNTVLVATSDGTGRNGSRDRKPEGLQIQWPPPNSTDTSDYLSSADGPRSHGSENRRSLGSGRSVSSLSGAAYDTRSDTRSPPTSSHSYKSGKAGRSIDEYINSLEEANYRAGKQQHHGHRARSRQRHYESSTDRGRSNHHMMQAKRSPSSPVPLSPEEFGMYNMSTENFEDFYKSPFDETAHSSSHRKGNSTSRLRHHNQSRSTHGRRRLRSKPSSRASSRRPSPFGVAVERGQRTPNDNMCLIRSPSSPLPMELHHDENLRLVEVDRQRLRSRQRSRSSNRSNRSRSRKPTERDSSAQRTRSPDRWRSRERSTSRHPWQRDSSARREGEHQVGNDLTQPDTQNSIKAADTELTRKELAQKELEARRISLASRPSAPNIPFPGEAVSRLGVAFYPRADSANHAVATSAASAAPGTSTARTTPVPTPSAAVLNWQKAVIRMKAVSDAPNSSASSGNDESFNGRVGLPATPRALRLPKYLGVDSASGGSNGNITNSSMPDITENLPMLTDKAFEPPRVQQLVSDPPRRSMSASMIEPFHAHAARPQAGVGSFALPADLPTHPAFLPQVPPSTLLSSRTHRGESAGAVDTSVAHPSDVYESTVRVATETECHDPPLLPQLQHLNSPLPSAAEVDTSSGPSPVGTINIAIDSEQVIDVPLTMQSPKKPRELLEPPVPPPAPQRPESAAAQHRRGRSLNEGFSSKLRSLTDRMRSTSRGRNGTAGSAPGSREETIASPYESVPPLKGWGQKAE